MKLKKIASLALAGILAVSMLAGCKNGESSSSSEGTVVTPVDNSVAAYVNDELTDEEKEVITYSSDTTVQAALEQIAGTIPAADLASDSSIKTWYTGIPATAFNELLEGSSKGPSEAFLAGNNNSEDTVATGMLIIPSDYTEEAMKKEALAAAKTLYTKGQGNYLPSVSDNGKYSYEYTGKIAVTQVTSNDGKYSAYVVGFVFEQTVTEVEA